MKKLKIYLDCCCFNRPFDDQSQLMVRLETEAKLFIQEKIKDEEIELIWSYVLDFENYANPYPSRRKSIQAWKSFAKKDVEETEGLLVLVESFEKQGLKPCDALHLASAVTMSADCFITVDKGILKKTINEISVMSPEKFIRYYEEISK